MKERVGPSHDLIRAPPSDLADDQVEQAPSDYGWIPFFLMFLLLAVIVAQAIGWRFVLYLPLVAIGFEMFAHPTICPWAGRPLVLPLACALTAAAGLTFVTLLGAGPLAAACSILFGALVPRTFDLHVPPAMAVGLLPFVTPHPDFRFPAAVAVGTLLQTSVFVAWRRLAPRPG